MFFNELRRRISVAFHLPPPVQEVPPELRELVDRLCAEVHRRGLVAPAILALESSVPLQYVAGQMCAFFAPVLAGLGLESRAVELSAFLDRPGAIEALCRRLEETSVAERQALPVAPTDSRNSQDASGKA